jgi:hypothetical protein
LGGEKPQSALCAFVGFSPPHFGLPQTCGLLYSRAKTSYTARTLCAIGAEMVEKYIKLKKFT